MKKRVHEGARISTTAFNSDGTDVTDRTLAPGDRSWQSSQQIVQVISAIDPEFGGPPTGALGFQAALKGLGWSSLILTTDAKIDGSRRTDSCVPIPSGGDRRVAVFPVAWPRRHHSSPAMVRRLWAETSRDRLLVLHGIHRLPVLLAAVFARLKGVDHVIWAHGSLEPYEDAHRLAKKLFNATVTRWLVGGALCVIFASDSEARRARRFVPEEKAVVHPLGVTLEDATQPAADDPIRAILERPRGSRYCFVGRLAKKKRPDILLEAWSRSEARHRGVLVFVGPDSDFTHRELADRAAALGVADSVILAQPRSAGDLTWVYESCSAFVLPSENENFALTVVEAMAAGCHVITTAEVAAHEHLLRAGSGALVGVGDVDGLIAALDAHAADAETSAASGERAQAYARSGLTWTAFASNLLAAARAQRQRSTRGRP